jgi:sorbitol/mannitol transport system substrate-binding protein
VQPRPTVGIQYVAIPEFTDVATKVTQDISAAIAGNGDVTAALQNGEQLAQTAGDKYKGK